METVHKPLQGHMRRNHVAQERESGTGHADDHVELAGLQPLHEPERLAVVCEGPFLYGWSDERDPVLPAYEGLHFLGAAAFETDNAKSGE